MLQAMVALGPEMAERFRLLGLLFVHAGEPLPAELLATLWQLRDSDALSCAEALEVNGLLVRDIWTGGLCLHELQQTAAREALPKEDTPEYQALHTALLQRAAEAFCIPPSNKRWTRHWCGAHASCAAPTPVVGLLDRAECPFWCPLRWMLPSDNPSGQYFMRNVVKHMDAAEQTKEACTLFFELPWLMARLGP